MNNYLTNMALAIVIVLLFLLLFGLFGGNAEQGFGGIYLFIFFIVAIIVVFISLFTGPFGIDLPFYLSDNDKAVIFGIIIILYSRR